MREQAEGCEQKGTAIVDCVHMEGQIWTSNSPRFGRASQLERNAHVEIDMQTVNVKRAAEWASALVTTGS